MLQINVYLLYVKYSLWLRFCLHVVVSFSWKCYYFTCRICDLGDSIQEIVIVTCDYVDHVITGRCSKEQVLVGYFILHCFGQWTEQNFKNNRVKKSRAVYETPSQSYGVSLAVWDHTVLSATRYKWTHPGLTPARQAGTRFTYPQGMEGWVDLGLLAHRQSPMQVLTRQCRAGSWTRYLLITSPTP